MQLTLWTYEGPPHVGAMRIAASMKDVHYVLHAPQGDTYADLLFTMIERRDRRPPVTYTTFQARDLGGDTANLLKAAVAEAFERFQPKAMLVGDSCTAELIQDQSGSLAVSMNLPIPVIPLELPAYSKKENWGAAETFYHLTRQLLQSKLPAPGALRAPRAAGKRPTANLLGPTLLGFRCRDDVTEITRLLTDLGIDINCIAPLSASPEDLQRIPDADFNIDLYPEVSRTTCAWLKRAFGMPHTTVTPMGVSGTRAFISEVASLAGIDASAILDREQPGISGMGASASRLAWYSRSVDSTYLTGKRVFIFADATHAIAAAKIASEELGLQVVGLGTYCRELARDVRAAAEALGLVALITDDYLEVEQAIRDATPELVLGTQMERHTAKRLGIPCAVISSPIHVQDVPARYSPVMGFEGANVLFDSWIHPLMMGLEEHLLTMFREDFEFHGDSSGSHLGHGVVAKSTTEPVTAPVSPDTTHEALTWQEEAEQELRKIPFFVRGKARRNTERFALDKGIATITIETLYDAKAHFGR